MSQLHIHPDRLIDYSDIYTDDALNALEHLAPYNAQQKELMSDRSDRRRIRIQNSNTPHFLLEDETIGNTSLTVKEAREGNFQGAEIPHDLQRQWIQGTGPAAKPHASTISSIRNVAYALLSGADGWMFDGEDALGQINAMSLDNVRNLKLAIHRDPLFLNVAQQVSEEMNKWSNEFLGKSIISDWKQQLDFTTIIYRVRGLHLDDRHITMEDGSSFSASISDLVLYVVNNYQTLTANNRSVVLYLPKIQTANEASFWNELLVALEAHLSLEEGTIKTYVLVEQLEAAMQLIEIRAALGKHFVGFNTGRWDYINSMSDALVGVPEFINPNIESITMDYSYMAAYEDRVRKAVNTPDMHGNYALWQGGMEPNIPVGSEKGVTESMKKAVKGAQREQEAGASGKWVAHWKMVHIIRPVWEKEGVKNQLGRSFGPLGYTKLDEQALMHLEKAPRTIRGARNLLSVALQYGNAFLQGYQAAALKPADFFGDDDILYLMEDMATGEIRVSVLWEWVHKKARISEADESLNLAKGATFTQVLFDRLLEEEYEKLLQAEGRDVHEDSKATTLPISKMIVARIIHEPTKAPWFIDLLNLNLNNTEFSLAEERVNTYFQELKTTGHRITANLDFVTLNPINV